MHMYVHIVEALCYLYQFNSHETISNVCIRPLYVYSFIASSIELQMELCSYHFSNSRCKTKNHACIEKKVVRLLDGFYFWYDSQGGMHLAETPSGRNWWRVSNVFLRSRFVNGELIFDTS